MISSFTQFMEGKDGGKKKKSYDFSSLLYIFPEKIANKIYKWGLSKVPDEVLFRDPEDPTFGREDEVHCTVIYGIHDKRSVETRKILKSVKPFEIKLGKITAFTAPEKFDVLKIDVVGSELHKLHDHLRDNLEVTESFPEYKPHVTIAYLMKGESSKYVGSDQFKDLAMKVDKLVFSSSAGVKTPILITNKS